ncbi:MAG: hypothetical protein FJY56_06305 [Betaproteobacteria bacterium]|nr:hypothetical protein [Betaproteobacteria bacterium]
MRTTLDLPEETFRKLKAEAALRGYKLKELVTEFIERGLNEGPQPPTAQSPRATYAIPIARKADGSITPALSNAELQTILDDEDLGQAQRAAQRNLPRQ